MVNSFPTNVKARRKGCFFFFFLNTEELEDFSETGLGFQKIPYGIICSRALAAPCSQRKFVLPKSAIHCAHSPHNLSDTVTADSWQYIFDFAYLWFL